MKNMMLLVLIIATIVTAQIWTRNGPYSAHVTSLAIAPTDSNTIYIGTFGDGVYKSINGAESWIKCSTVEFPEWSDSLNNIGNMPCWWYGETYPINDIAIDPTDKDHVWIGFASKGLYESIDAGSTWNIAVSSLPDSLDVDYIHINNNNPDKILIGAGNHNYESYSPLENGGLYLTENSGDFWSVVDSVPHGNSYNISSLSTDFSNEDHIYVGVNSSGEPDFSWGLMESMDSGTNWNTVSEEYSYYDVHINPLNDQNIFTVINNGWGDWYLAESEDGGTTWTPDYTPNWVTSLYSDKEYNLYAAEGWENELDGNIKKSTDGGNSWSYIDTLCAGRGVNLRNRCETNYSNINNIYFGTYCGTYKSINGGINCDMKNTNIFNSYIRDIEIHPKNNNLVYAGGYQGLWKSNDGCESWDMINDENIYAIMYDNSNPDTLYYCGQNLMRSIDGGITFQDIKGNLPNLLFWDIKVDPVDKNKLYVVASNASGMYVCKSVDFGSNWEMIFGSGFIGYPFITIDPINPDTLYYNKSRSVDGGNSWTEVFSDQVIAVHPINSNIIYCSDRNTLNISYDWGNTFEIIDQYENWTGYPVPAVNNLTFDKINPDIMLYCTPNNGIHHSSDGGKNWFVLDGSYEKRTLDAIPVPNEDKIYVASHGDGVWMGENVSLGINDEQSTISNYELSQNYPNPFNPITEIEYSIKNSGFVKLSIFNSKGQFVTDLVNKKMSSGIYKINFNAESLNSGIYFYQLSVDGIKHRSKKMLYLR